MISLTTLTFILSAAFVSASEPSCVQLGMKVCGTGLPGLCVHSTTDYSVAFDVVDGVADLEVEQLSGVALELYSGARMVTESDDCCPPHTFLTEYSCTVVEEAGSCCYDDSHVHVSGLGDFVGCVHDVVDYGSFNPVDGAVSIALDEPSSNHEVEVYAGQHGNGCCACFMHSIPCGPCEV